MNRPARLASAWAFAAGLSCAIAQQQPATTSSLESRPQPQSQPNPATEPKYFYWGDDEQIPLTLDTTRIVFFGAGEAPVHPPTAQSEAAWARVREIHPKALARAGVSRDRITPVDQHFCWEVDVADLRLNEEQIEQLVAQIAADDETYFVGPVWFCREPDRRMRPTRRAIVRFDEDVADVTARDLLFIRKLGTIVSEHHDGLPRDCAVLLDTKNGFQALRDVTSFHTLRLVECCDLDWIVTGRTGLTIAPSRRPS